MLELSSIPQCSGAGSSGQQSEEPPGAFTTVAAMGLGGNGPLSVHIVGFKSASAAHHDPLCVPLCVVDMEGWS
jgi:hypothetical protein